MLTLPSNDVVPAAAFAVEGPFWSLEGRAPFRSLFTTRIAGTSGGAYDSLNLALHVGDDPRRVRENRRLVFDASGLNSTQAVVAQQVHGGSVAVVGEEDAGCGCFSHADAVPGVDALVTRAKNLPLMCFSADCLLVALSDPQAGVLALLHAGWRGMAAGVIENTINTMHDQGADPSRIHAVGGPSIGPCCFEVGAEVVSALGAEHVAQQLEQKALYDLRKAAQSRLELSGVRHVHIDPTCTCCRADLFFSHRRATRKEERNTGRMAMVAWQ
jgi:YfiH family protein